MMHISTALPGLLAGLDFHDLVCELEASLRRHGGRTEPQPFDLMYRQVAGTLGAIASFAMQSDRIARAVVSHVRVAPWMVGIAFVVHPRPELDAPLLVGDLMVPPFGATRAYVDVCGAARSSMVSRFATPLEAVLAAAPIQVERLAVPDWIASSSLGAGARLKAGRGRGTAVAKLLAKYFEVYLEALDGAVSSLDGAENLASAKTMADAVRTHGPALRHLRRVFGEPFASRYGRLLWRDQELAPN
ncbi:MAG: hypothetical protein WCI05_15755 [Myxococcales bacterium]